MASATKIKKITGLPRTILGYEKHERNIKPEEEPQIVKLYGENHNPRSEKQIQDLLNLFRGELDADDKAKLIVEGNLNTLVYDWNPQTQEYDVPARALQQTYSKLSKEYGDRVVHADDRFNPYSFGSDKDVQDTLLNDLDKNDEPDFSKRPGSREKSYSIMYHKYREPLKKMYPSYIPIFDELTPEKGGHPYYFTLPVLDKQILDIIEDKDSNPIFFVGDVHRESIGKTLSNDTQKRWRKTEEKKYPQTYLKAYESGSVSPPPSPLPPQKLPSPALPPPALPPPASRYLSIPELEQLVG